MVEVIINGKLFREAISGGELTFLSSSNGKLDPSLMRNNFSAIGLITKVNEILASLDLKDGLLALRQLMQKNSLSF
ncbi:MAG: hypothetical protein ACLTOX_00880 [Streptococcus thermophilus]